MNRIAVALAAALVLVAPAAAQRARRAPPPPALTPEGPRRPVTGVSPGFVCCVSRLLPYKNVDAVVDAFCSLREEQLVVVGSGPDEQSLRLRASNNVTLLGRVTDEQLRWLYANADLLVAASHEDYGLTPLEAATFGKPSVVLRWGGFLDTVQPGETGMFFETPTVEAIAAAIRDARTHRWDSVAIRAHADAFAEPRFIDRIREIVNEVA